MNDIKKTIDGLKRMRIGLFNGKIDGEPMKPYLDAAIEALEKQLNDEVKDLVEVIRCKDCSYSEKRTIVGNGITEPPYVTVWRCDVTDLGMQEDDYCNYGEKGK